MHASFSNLGEELTIPSPPPIQRDHYDADSIDCEQCSYTVEFRGEYLEGDESKGELRERGTNVGSFEGTLGRADLDESVRSNMLVMMIRAVCSSANGRLGLRPTLVL